MFRLDPHPPALAAQTVDALSKVCTSTLGHLTDFGFPRGLTPVSRPCKFAGPAVTVRIPHMDSTAVHVALDHLRPGDVLVIDQSGDHSRSCFGGMVSYTAHARGAAGAVVDGAINDYDEIIELGLPVFSRAIASHTTRILGIEGEINVPVTVGGVTVRPGDVVFGDSDGIAILDPAQADRIAAVLMEKEAAEPELKKRIDAGASLAEFTGALALFEKNLVS